MFREEVRSGCIARTGMADEATKPKNATCQGTDQLLHFHSHGLHVGFSMQSLSSPRQYECGKSLQPVQDGQDEGW